MKSALLFLFLVSSCGSMLSKGSPKEIKRSYAYLDSSGRFTYTREHKLLKKKLISRTQISSSGGNSSRPLEKSIMVSQLGSVKERNKRSLVMRPFASEFTVWLEGKSYESKMRLDPKTKSMIVDLKSPESKWNGRSSVPVPKGKVFCFFSQIPDCLYHNQFLIRTSEKKGESLSFYVVWDSYPYIQDQFSGVGSKLFAPAVVKYEGENKNVLRFLVEVDGQSIAYHFTKSFDLVRMFWIAQGISIIPPHEENNDLDE